MRSQEITSSKPPKSKEKTEAILKGAMAEFLANGYAATSMNRVAAAAGVSKATVYGYFGHKKRLFNILIEKLTKEKLVAVSNLINPQFFQEEPRTALNTIATELLDNIGGDRNFQNLMRIIVGESGRFPELAIAYVNNFAKSAIDILAHYLKSHPKLNLRDEEATARVFIGTLVHYVMLQQLLYGNEIVPLELNCLVNTLTDLIIVSK